MSTVSGSPPSDTPGNGSPDAEMISMEATEHRDATVVHVSGEIDMVTTPRLHACLQERLGKSPRLLVVDLSGVSFLGSSGLAVLVESLETARRRGSELRLVASSREVVRPLEATGLTELFQSYPDLDSALAR